AVGARVFYLLVNSAAHRESPKRHSIGDLIMKRINNWKTIAFAAIVPLLIAWQPAITYACTTCGSHGGA
ncbi:MAG: hypothetical protein KC419_24405, partial [Anaerolineales bacterium]|nr:hypothetical protein [Anaerolineales bacterium]